jgi:hypothetical protein
VTLATGDLSQPRVARRRPRWRGLPVVGVVLMAVVGTAGIVSAQRRSTVEDLRTLLVPRPSSATERPSNGFSNPDGTIPIELAAKSFEDQVGVDTLRRWGYLRGARAGWKDGELVVSILLFQFDSAPGADQAVASLQKTPYEASGYTVVRAGDLANGGRFFVSQDAGGLRSYDTYFAKHGIAVMVGTSPRDSSDALDRTVALAQRQYELLP